MTVALADLLANSPLQRTRDAIVATLGQLFPDIEVKSHPGRLDMADILAKGLFTAPSIHVSVWRMRNEERCSADQDLPVHWRAYVFAEDREIGGLVYKGDEIGYAIMLGLLDALADWPFAMWGLENVSAPSDAEGEPLLTLKTFEKGQCFYVVTWRQTLMYAGAIGDNLGGDWTVDAMPIPQTAQTFIPGGVISTATTDTRPGGIDLLAVHEGVATEGGAA